MLVQLFFRAHINTISFLRYSSQNLASLTPSKARTLYKYLLRQCEKLPKGAKEHYRFTIKQSFIQHLDETDPERIKQIIKRSYEDASWVLKKDGPQLHKDITVLGQIKSGKLLSNPLKEIR